MLFYIGPVAVFALVFFLNLSVINRGRWPEAIGYGVLFMAFSYVVFGAIVPGIATYNSDEYNVRSTENITGQITAGVTGQNGEVVINYITENGSPESLSTDDDYFSLVRKDIESPIVHHACDETPDWSAPFTIGTCGKQIVLPLDYELVMN